MVCENRALITPSSLLRPWREEDRDSLVTHADNVQIASYMRDGFPNPYTLADADRFIAMATGDQPHLFLAIEMDGSAVGGIGIYFPGDIYRQTGEIGYWISQEYRGRGIVTDAIRVILPVAFKSYDIIRIQAGVFSNNPVSMRVLIKNGFLLEAVHKNAITKYGIILDEYLYVIFRDQIII